MSDIVNLPPGAPSGPSINLSELPYIECESCKGQVFEEKMMFKLVSRFMTGSEKDSIVPVPVIACSGCGHINEMFKPKNV